MSFYLLKRSKFIHQILFWIYTIYTLFILYILSSKVAILFIGFYLGVLFVSRVLWLLKVKQNILFSMVTITVLAILIYSFRLDLVRLLFGEGESVLWHQDLIGRLKYFLETGDPVRHENWKASLIVIKENLFFGVGVGDAIFELQKLRSPSSWAYVEGANTHNQFLGITVAGGLIAMVSFLAFVVSLFNESIKAKSLVLTYFILLLMVFMFIENIFARHAGVIFFAFFLFLFVRANEIKKC